MRGYDKLKTELMTWAKPMDYIISSEFMDDLMSDLNLGYDLNAENSRYPIIYPDRNDIFKAFRRCPYDKLKVVVLAQDPYCDGRATGVAFANEDETKLSPELELLYKAIYGDAFMINPNLDTSLDNLSAQGILFLNSILTVCEGEPLSHFTMWNRFTINLLEMLSKEKEKIIYCLLGETALSFKQFINSQKNIILISSHPTTAVKENKPWDNHYFKTMNILLENQKTRIVW